MGAKWNVGHMQLGFLRNWNAVLMMSRTGWPACFKADRRADLALEVVDWLNNKFGSSGSAWGTSRFTEPGQEPKIALGFRFPQHAVEFGLEWRGVRLG